MPKKKQPKRSPHVPVTVRLPPHVAKRLELGLKAAVRKFERGIVSIKPTLNAFVVDALVKTLAGANLRRKVAGTHGRR